MYHPLTPLNRFCSRLRDSAIAMFINQNGFGMEAVEKYMGGIIGTGLFERYIKDQSTQQWL
jgi:hypothetical protein